MTNVLDRLEGRETCNLVLDVGQPAVSRVIGSFMGLEESEDAIWANLVNATLGAGTLRPIAAASVAGFASGVVTFEA